MQQTIYKLSTLSILSLLTIIVGISYFQKNSNTELLSSRLDLIEEKIYQSKPNTDFDTSNLANNELANLQEQISTLQNQLDRMDSDLDYDNEGQQIVSKNKKMTTTETQPDENYTDQQQEIEVIDSIKNTGYLYEEDWKNLEQMLASMDKDENKRFWQSITRAIENNEIELYSE